MHSPERKKRDSPNAAQKKNMGLNKAEIEAVELVLGAWPKLEKLVKSAAQTGPKPHSAKDKGG